MSLARLAAVIALLLLTAGPAQAETVLHTAAQIDSDPKFIDLESGRSHVVSGICIDIYRAIEQTEPELHIVGDQDWKPAPRIEHMLISSHLDIACGLVRSAQLEAETVYIEPKLLTFSYRLAVRADDPVEVSNWDDVRKLGPDSVILANHGWSSTQQLQEISGLHIDSNAYTSSINLQKLNSGHGRFFYFRDPGFAEAIHRAGVEGRIRVLHTAMKTSDVFLVARNGLAPETTAMLKHAVATLDSDGELARLASKWSRVQETRVP